MWTALLTWIIWNVLIAVRQSNGQIGDYQSKFQPSTEPKTDAILFLREFDREASEMCNRIANAEWRYATNSTDYNKRRMREQQSIASKFDCISWRRAHAINESGEVDANIRRQFQRILNHGHCGLGEVKFLELSHVLSLMKDNYNSAKICPYAGNKINSMSQTYKTDPSSVPANYVRASTTYCDLKLDPDIIRVMQRSRSEPELRYAWSAWRDVTGPSIRNTFMRYIDLANQAARMHGFKDAGDQMRSEYEDPEFYFTVQDLWYKIQPLYKQLFTFVRRGLVKFYGSQVLRPDGPIPAHILGDVWGQNWNNILDIVKPGPSEIPDVTGEMIKQGYTPLRIFQAAEYFFTSMGLPPMLPEFWRNSVLQKPNESFGQCAPSAWDFCNNIDFRIKQCTQVSLGDYINAHHEVAHIQYYMHYATQPFVFRDGPNPAFHEAVSNAIGLGVAGPVHLQKIGLLPKSIEIESGNSMLNIEFLLEMALDKLPFMVFSLTLEKWRWHIFEKGPVGMNGRWWELHLRYMGLIPPVPRTNDHFDPGAKYHVISDQEYIKYFIGTILQFQIFEEMCHASNHIGPLHTCDFHRSRDSGRVLTDIMQKGAALPMDQLIKLITRGKSSKISADALLDYFRPLEAWLEIQNRDEAIVGWNSNMDDVALYQPLLSNSFRQCSSTISAIFISVLSSIFRL